MPKNTPMPTLTTIPSTTVHSGTSVGRFGRKKRVACETAQPNSIPINPPSPVSTTASVRNWMIMSPRRAPMALRTPISRVRSVTSVVALVMVVLSSIGLLVGGIGVMNIMLVSVTERTREIGVRKAIGARRGDIIIQFLTEAVVLTGLGGLIGMLFGWAVSQLTRFFLPNLPTLVPLWAVLLGIAVSVGIGVFFGIWPASKAARLDPVEALRYE